MHRKQFPAEQPAGVGTALSWAGNSKVGEGRMMITESRPDELIRFKLDFVKPFACSNLAEFTFKPEGGQTVVTWSMSGENNFFAKAASLVMNMDKMVGGDFEKGLATLKALSESAAGKQAANARRHHQGPGRPDAANPPVRAAQCKLDLGAQTE